VIDVPKSPLAQSLNGLQVKDWLVHGRDGPTASRPPYLAGDLLARFGDDMTDRSPEYLCAMEMLPENRHEVFVDRLLAGIEWKTAATIELLRHAEWELFLVVFKEAHCAGHQFWHLVDPLDGDADARLPEGTNPVLRVYRALDEAVGRLLAEIGGDTDVIVFSDLGMTTNNTGEHLLEAVLLRLDGLPLSLWQRLDRAGARAPFRPVRRGLRAAQHHLYGYRTAFQVEHNELSGAVRLNVSGRDPHGRVHPGPELEAALDRLTEDLLQLVEPESGRPIVTSILRTDDVFGGGRRDQLPDLFVLWDRSHPIRAASSPKIGVVRVQSPKWRTGNHAADGFFYACGPSALAGQHGERGSVTDLGPTIGSLLGVALPRVDGQPLRSFTPSRLDSGGPSGSCLGPDGGNATPRRG
jgi:predicted AlkP superfamily phosphohydrolase/phosphomutase